MAKRDYYEILNTDRNVTEDQLKGAYRKLAKKYHPDINQGDKDAEAKFKEINEAYKILSDPKKRSMYDQFGHAGVNGNGNNGGYSGFGGFDGFGDIFDMFFGGNSSSSSRRQRNTPQRGADLRYDLDIAFKEAVFGVEKEIKVSKLEICANCNGSGAKPGTGEKVCTNCNGAGEIRQEQATAFGRVVNVQPCYACNGEGKVVEELCPKCKGKRRIRRNKTISVKIPAGIDSGQAITLRGEGEPGNRGGPNGDLYIYITVRPHELFKRHGNDIHCEVPVTFAQAALGDEFEVPIIDGTDKCIIPEGTQTGTVFKIRGKGVPSLRGYGRGDHFVKIVVEVPRRLSAEQKDLLRKFEEATGAKEIHEQRKSFFEKMKEVLGV